MKSANRVARNMWRLAQVFAVLVVVGGGAVLAGYGLHDLGLVRVHRGLQAMSPITTVGLICAALSIIFETFDRSRIALVFGATTAGIGVGMLVVQIVTGGDVLSPWVAAHVFGFDPAQAGRTSPATAACLFLLGAADLGRVKASLADVAAGVALIVSGAALLGYAYGVADLYAIWVFRTMALHTAAGLFMLAAASLAARPEAGWASVVASDTIGGGATRRQLAFMLIPPLAGWVLLKTTNAHDLGPAAAMALLIIFMIVPLALLIVRDGRILDSLDAERRTKASLQRQLQDDLETRLQGQAIELQTESAERQRAEAALSRAQRMEAVGQLTGGIAHDFNNLLMAVGGNLQLLSKRLEADHPARRFADNATSAVDKGAKLTAQLLAFSRTQKLDARPIELDRVLTNAREILGAALGPTIEIHVRLDAEGAWALSDSDQLELAILNLALNARDSMPGGGDLTIVSGSCRACLGGEATQADYLSVRVSDTGDGMPPEVVERAIEPFFTTKERGRGTGLGLAQVYGFVRQCGGDLRITSEVGEGTTVELLLPRIEAPATQAAAPEAQASPPPSSALPSRRRTLLVIDDDEGVRTVLVEALRAAGYDVVEASDGQAGLDLLDRLAPSAAIIDFIMPGMNGAEVARRARVQMPALPVIFVSGYFDTIALDGITGAVIVRKPIDLDGLQRAVSSVLH